MNRSRPRRAEGAAAEVGALAPAWWRLRLVVGLLLEVLRRVVVLRSLVVLLSSGGGAGAGAASGDNATARMAAATAALGGRAVNPGPAPQMSPESPRSIRRSLA